MTENKKPLPNLCDDKASCCGCSACYTICPVSAISMQADEKAFLYPQVNGGECIRCYKCIGICQFKKDQA